MSDFFKNAKCANCGKSPSTLYSYHIKIKTGTYQKELKYYLCDICTHKKWYLEVEKAIEKHVSVEFENISFDKF